MIVTRAEFGPFLRVLHHLPPPFMDGRALGVACHVLQVVRVIAYQNIPALCRFLDHRRWSPFGTRCDCF